MPFCNASCAVAFGSRTRPALLRSALSLVPVDAEGNDHRAAGYGGALASSRLSALLALEVEKPGRAAADLKRVASVDPTDEPRKHALGCAAHSWRVAQAGVHSGPVDGGQIHGKEGRRPFWSALEHVPAQSYAQIAAIDLFVVPSIGFRLLYALVIVRLARRELVWINVTAHPTADWIAQQITEAFPWDQAPRYLIRDRDAVYRCVVTRRLRAMGIRDKPISAGSPWQNGYVERLIGSIRRECVDHVVALGRAHLCCVLRSYARYYNETRTHRALNKDAPLHRSIERLGVIASRPILGGLHHQYCRMMPG